MPSARRIWLGREREIGEIEVGLDELIAGRGGLFLVTGEPGIGKTRFGDEVSRSASSRGIAVHWGRAWEAGGAPSYWPFVQVLRSICRGIDGDVLGAMVGGLGGELAELLPELRERIPALASASPPARERFQLFDAVATFLHAAAARAPHVLVFDDLHAADPSSLLMLHFLVRDLRSAPLLVVGAYREAEARMSPEIGKTLTLIAREACLLPLRRLDAVEVANFVEQATGATPSAERVQAIHQRTEGNPLFLRELLLLRGPSAVEPEGIREVVRQRLLLLTIAVRRALEVAAVLGRDFDLDSHAAVTASLGLDGSEWIAVSVDAGFLEAVELPTRWRFTHVLLREGLYDALPAEQRASIHAAVAAGLRMRAGESPLTELAHHLLHAVSVLGVSEATDSALRAADRAMTILAFEDASAVLARVLKLLESAAGEERRRYEVLLALGTARIRAGNVIVGKGMCLSATELARRIGDGELLARAVLGATCEFTPGIRDLVLIRRLEEALTALPIGDGALRARCMAQLAAERQPEPDTGPVIELARAAVAMARRVGDPETLRFTLSNAGLAMLAFGDPAERFLLDQETLRLAVAAGDKVTEQRAHLLLTSDCWEQGDRPGGVVHARAVEELVQLRHTGYGWMGCALRSIIALSEGRFDEAEKWHERAEELARGDETSGAELVSFPLGFCRASERYEARAAIEARLRSAFGSTGNDLRSCIGDMLVTQLSARVGDRASTARQLTAVRAHPVFPEIEEASWLALLVEPCHLLGDVALAEQLYPALLPRASRFFWPGPGSYHEPPYNRQLGLLAETLGRFDDAVAHLAAAEASVVAAEMSVYLPRLRYELAGALLARGGAGDRERAAELLDVARQMAKELDQTALVPLLAERSSLAGAIEAPIAPLSAVISGGAISFALRRDGDYWTIESGSRELRLRDSRGLQLLDRLVSSPGQEHHVLHLVSSGEGVVDRGDAGEVLDDAAVESYRLRLLDLREDLEEAEGFSDAGRTARARDEIENLTQELARAVGLGGRGRRAGEAAERARTTVQKRLRTAIRRIEEELPELGRHLDQAIRTGAFCGYLPAGRAASRRK